MTGGKTVLIVEDSPTTLKAIQMVLKTQGYKVVAVATDGEEGVAQYLKTEPDVVLMDIALPKKDGLTATKEIIAKDPDARIVVVSALYDPKKRKEALELGAKAFITKPFEIPELVRALQEVSS